MGHACIHIHIHIHKNKNNGALILFHIVLHYNAFIRMLLFKCFYHWVGGMGTSLKNVNRCWIGVVE